MKNLNDNYQMLYDYVVSQIFRKIFSQYINRNSGLQCVCKIFDFHQ